VKTKIESFIRCGKISEKGILKILELKKEKKIPQFLIAYKKFIFLFEVDLLIFKGTRSRQKKEVAISFNRLVSYWNYFIVI